MSQFIYAQMEIHDRKRYNLYMNAATPIFIREGVKVHAADDAPRPNSADVKVDKVVLLEFRDKAHMKDFFALPDYIKAGIDRDASTTMKTMVFERFKGL